MTLPCLPERQPSQPTAPAQRPAPRLPKLPLRWLALVVGAGLLAGCAGNPLPADPNAAPVVTRTPGSTVWATPEAEAAAAAAAEAAAAARRAGARRPATAAAPPAPAPAAAAAAAAASAPAVATPPPAPADVAAPLQRLVFFDFDSFDIHPDFQAMLEGHALALKADPSRQLIVEGHADDRGGAEYNLALGQKRAEAVVKALRLMGARDNQLEAVSFGDTRPVDPARTFEAWAKNRRAELRER
jgi:peptidoglycan-associated lipoprotein